MPDITYPPFYSGGWHDEPVEDSAIDAAALSHFDTWLAAIAAQANIGARAAAGALYAINNLSDVADPAASLAHLGGQPAGTGGGGGTTPTGLPTFIQLNANYDGSDEGAKLQAAIDAANALPQGAIVVGDTTKTLITNRQIIWKSGVRGMFGFNAPSTGNAKHSMMLAPGPSFPTDTYLIDTTTAAIVNASITGLSIACPVPTSTSSPRYGGIRFQLANYCTIAGCTVGGTSLSSINLVNGVGCLIENCGVQQFTTYRSLTASEGALDVGGTDHTIRRCQCNGGDNTRVYYPGTYYRCGFVFRGLTSWIYDVNGEYADCGVKILGSFNRFYGIRGDVNAGCGIRIEGAALENILLGVVLYANSCGAVTSGIRGEHDGIYVDTLSLGNIIDSVVATTLTGPVTVGPLAGQNVTLTSRYIINDQANPGTDPATAGDGYTRISNIQAPINTYEIDKVKQLVVFEALDKPRACAPNFRPASRRSAGVTMANTTDHRSAYSDGKNWRSVFNDLIVGNRFTPEGAVPRETTTWAPYLGTSTLPATPANGEGGSANKGNTIFKVPRVNQLTCTAGGASAGAMAAISEVVPVEAGNVFNLGAYARGITKSYTITPTLSFYTSTPPAFGGTGTLVGSASTLAGVAVPASPTTPTKCLWSGITVPATATVVLIEYAFTVTGLASGDQAEFTKSWLSIATDNTTSPARSYTTTDYSAP